MKHASSDNIFILNSISIIVQKPHKYHLQIPYLIYWVLHNPSKKILILIPKKFKYHIHMTVKCSWPDFMVHNLHVQNVSSGLPPTIHKF